MDIHTHRDTRFVQKVLSLTKKEHFYCSNILPLEKLEKTNSDFSIFIKSGGVLPQLKCTVMLFVLCEA